MSSSHEAFVKSQKSVLNKHRRMASGYHTTMDENGTFIQKPNALGGVGFAKPAVLLLGLFVGLKVLFQAYQGPEEYAEHVDALSQGNLAEQIGSFVMTPDPITSQMAAFFSEIL